MHRSFPAKAALDHAAASSSHGRSFAGVGAIILCRGFGTTVAPLDSPYFGRWQLLHERAVRVGHLPCVVLVARAGHYLLSIGPKAGSHSVVQCGCLPAAGFHHPSLQPAKRHCCGWGGRQSVLWFRVRCAQHAASFQRSSSLLLDPRMRRALAQTTAWMFSRAFFDCCVFAFNCVAHRLSCRFCLPHKQQCTKHIHSHTHNHT